MAMFKSIESINSALDNIPVKKGQFITVKDTKSIYLDTSDNERIQIGDMFLINTEVERERMLAPLPFKMYLVKETCKLYVHNSIEWIDLFKSNVSIERQSYELTNNAEFVQLNIPNYDKERDTLIIYMNSVYLNEDTDYTIDVDSKLKPVGSSVWKALPESKAIFNILLFKNVSKNEVVLANAEAESSVQFRASELHAVKQENASMLHVLMMNNLDVKGLLNYDKIHELYTLGLWSRTQVEDACNKNIITLEEKEKILAI